MPHSDPYERSPPYIYECEGCDRRVEAGHQPTECPECGGAMKDISVPQE